MTPTPPSLDGLLRGRPRSRFLQTSLLVCLLGPLLSWWLGGFSWSELVSPRRTENLRRFLREIRPHPLQDTTWDWSIAITWATDLLEKQGWDATITTLSISILAILLAAILGGCLAFPGSRNLTQTSPFLSEGGVVQRRRRWGWRALYLATRFFLTLLRAVPEYVLAFLFLSLFGPSAWPAILALAIHNAGILGRLGAETIEDLDPTPLAAMRALGARRATIVATGILPTVFPRFLVYFFYRWETCVREATVLGMLGIASLGLWISEARARGQYDSMLFLIGLGVVLVLIGDLISAVARHTIRRA